MVAPWLVDRSAQSNGKGIIDMRSLWLALALLIGLTAAACAQGCGAANPNCVVPTAPLGTSNNRAASTAFVVNALAGSIPATHYDFLIGNASAIAVATALAGDCTYGASGIVCLSTNGVAFTSAATTAIGTSGATIPLNNANNTFAGNNTYSGTGSFTAAQTFINSDLQLLGSSTGYTSFASANAGASNYTATFPAATDTIAELTQTQTLTNKTIAFASNTLTGVAPLASPTFSGTVTMPDSGTWTSAGIEGSVIGAASPEAITGTTINASSGFSANGTAGVASKSCAITTANVSTGITLTIKEGLITGTTTC